MATTTRISSTAEYGSNGKSQSGSAGFVAPRVSEFKIKEEICEIGRRIWLKGFCAGNEGNHSYRIGENRVLCTPTNISKGQLKVDDICTIDMEGNQLAGKRKRTSEIMLHLAIYKARPDVKAVIHSHPPHATAFAIANIDLPTCIHPEAEVFLGAVKTAKYVTPGDKRLGESIMPYVKDSNTVLLQNHGTVSFAEGLEEAYYKLEIVDAYARILILAKQVGGIRTMAPDEMKELLELKTRFGLKEPRLADGMKNLVCASDFVSRVAAETSGSRGRIATSTGTAPAPGSCSCPAGSSAIEQAIAAMAPGQYGEDEIETLVQTITDQIVATMA
jgi:L-fuculose-phosphate aldolase